jgi:hypothetical protein
MANPLTPTEIEDILRRVEIGESLSASELTRIERNGNIVGRNIIIAVHRNGVTVKRIAGLDFEIL